MLCFPFKLAWHVKDTEVLTMLTWVITAHETIKPEAEAKRVTVRTALPRKFQVHVGTLVSCFLNATEASELSGSRHFHFFLPAPSSSCLFLPVKTKFGDSVDEYSLCFWGWHFFPTGVYFYFSSLHESITPACWRRLQVFLWSMFRTLQIWNLLRRGLVVCGWIFPHCFFASFQLAGICDTCLLKKDAVLFWSIFRKLQI